MSRVYRHYGRSGQTAAQVGLELGATQESLAAFLGARVGGTVGRTTVKHWAGGAQHAPWDGVVALAEHVGGEDGLRVLQAGLADVELDGRPVVVAFGGPPATEAQLGALEALARAGAFVSEVSVALQDGRLDASEREAIAEQARRLRLALDGVVGACR